MATHSSILAWETPWKVTRPANVKASPAYTVRYGESLYRARWKDGWASLSPDHKVGAAPEDGLVLPDCT